MPEQSKGFEGEPKIPSPEKQPTINELKFKLSSLNEELDVAKIRLNDAEKKFDGIRRDVNERKAEALKEIERLEAIETLKSKFVDYIGEGIEALRQGKATGTGYWFKEKGFDPDFFINEVDAEAWRISNTLSGGGSYAKIIGYEEVEKLWNQVVQDKGFTAEELQELVEKEKK